MLLLLGEDGEQEKRNTHNDIYIYICINDIYIYIYIHIMYI